MAALVFLNFYKFLFGNVGKVKRVRNLHEDLSNWHFVIGNDWFSVKTRSEQKL